MSWVTLMAPTMGASGLGSARASAGWGWAEPRAHATPHAPERRRAPNAMATIGPAPMTTVRTMVFTAGGPRGVSRGELEHAPAPTMRISQAATPGVAQSIAEAARLLGRDEGEVWAEAAREWLSHHLGLVAIAADDANDDPPPSAPAAAVAARRAGRCWSVIDELLADLRAPAA